MHKLCHLLNKHGQEAYVTTAITNPAYNTPHYPNVLYDVGDDAIAVYPEITRGNMMGASRVVRLVLAKPGLLGGDVYFDEDERVFAYSDLFVEYADSPDHVVRLYPDDTDYYLGDEERTHRCYFVGKASRVPSAVAPNTVIDDLPDWTQISSSYPSSNKKLKNLFRKSQIFYSFYSHTWLTIEAPLCGCPTVIIPEGLFTREQIEHDYPGLPGIAWGEEDLPRAKKTIVKARELYDQLLAQEDAHITRFITLTSKW